MCKFGLFILGGSMKILSETEWDGSPNLSPTWKYYLGMAVRAVRA